MKEDVTRRCDGVVSTTDFTERMQIFRPRRAEQPIPCVGAKRHDTGEPTLQVTEAHGFQKGGQITTEGPHGRSVFRSGVYRHDQEDSGACECCGDWLRGGG